MLQFFLWICIFSYSSALTNLQTSSCRENTIYAARSWKSFSSPNYPNKFPKQTQCNWIIRAPYRYRVELKFKDFYLLGTPQERSSCFIQHLAVRDPFSGVKDGRYCGNTIPPAVVSTGQSLRVTLESDAVRQHGQYYKGFKAFYRSSRKPSSFRLRDIGGKWLSYSVNGGDETTTTTTTVFVLPTRNANEVDDNDNAAIDAINNKINSQNVNNNQIVNKRNNELNNPPDYEVNDPEPSKYPSKVRLPVRSSIRTTTASSRVKVEEENRPYPSNKQVRQQTDLLPKRPEISVKVAGNEDDDKTKNTSDQSLIIGLAIGGLLILLILLAVVVWIFRKKIFYRNRKNSKRTSHVKRVNSKTKKSNSSTYQLNYVAFHPKHHKNYSSVHKKNNLPGHPTITAINVKEKDRKDYRSRDYTKSRHAHGNRSSRK